MSLPIIQALWIGNALSKLEQLCIRSFLENGHAFHLYVNGKVQGVPTGTVLVDANTILPVADWNRSPGQITFFSEWFRWELLEQRGGFWVDMDVVCLRPFAFDGDIVFGQESVKGGSVGVICFPAHHPMSVYMIERCKYPARYDAEDTIALRLKKYFRNSLQPNKKGPVGWGEAGGPRGFRKGLARFGLAHLVSPIDTFYPIAARDWRTVFDTTFANTLPPFETSYSVHLWNELLRRHRVDKNATFPENSLIEQLKARYHVVSR